MNELYLAFSLFSYFQIQNIECKIRKTEDNTVKYKNKIQNAKRNKTK